MQFRTLSGFVGTSTLARWPTVCCLFAAIVIAGCGSPRKPVPVGSLDAELLNAAAAGQLAFSRGAHDVAAEQYRRALDRARVQDDPALVGDQAYNLAVTLAAQGKTAEALDRLREAHAAQKRAGVPLADVFLVEARLLYSLADTERASSTAGVEEATKRVLDDPASKPQPMHRAQVEVLLAEIACDRRDAESASRHLSEANRHAPSAPSASQARASARVQMLLGNTAAAAKLFDEEAQLQRQSTRYVDMVRALLRAGEAYAKAGQSDAAADRFYRAAASYAGQGHRVKAIAALDGAEDSASKSRDPLQIQVIQSLKRELAPPVPATDTASPKLER